jgi:hypothetical protein
LPQSVAQSSMLFWYSFITRAWILYSSTTADSTPRITNVHSIFPTHMVRRKNLSFTAWYEEGKVQKGWIRSEKISPVPVWSLLVALRSEINFHNSKRYVLNLIRSQAWTFERVEMDIKVFVSKTLSSIKIMLFTHFIYNFIFNQIKIHPKKWFLLVHVIYIFFWIPTMTSINLKWIIYYIKNY